MVHIKRKSKQKKVISAVSGEAPWDTSVTQKALRFLRDWSPLTNKFALASVAFPFSSL